MLWLILYTRWQKIWPIKSSMTSFILFHTFSLWNQYQSYTSDITLTEPSRALQPKCTHWFPQIGLFVIPVISLGPCRGPIEFLTSSHPCRHLSKIPNSQIHKVKKWKFLSHFRRKDFFVILHEHRDRFFVVIWPKKKLLDI